MSESDLGYQPGSSVMGQDDPMAYIGAALAARVRVGPLEFGGGAGLALAPGSPDGGAEGTDPFERMAAVNAAAVRAQYDTQIIRQVPLMTQNIVLSGGNGSLVSPGQYGPPTGCYWSVRRITCWGFTAGTVAAYLDSLAGEAVAPFAQAGTFTFGRGELLINPQSYLLFQALAVTGTVAVAGRADQFPVPHLRYYLG
jgi:hypothetical protein